MKRLDYYGRSFTVSDTFAEALVGYVNRRVEGGLPLGEFLPVRCYTTDPDAVVEVTIQLVSGVPILIYPADVTFIGAEIVDDPETIARLHT
ncbi:MAG TPA: hypothetical protein VFT01_05120 [Homoserinimonas sp.]|nr:hypothetical protein [Homoserinimonas sp.]